MFTHGVGSPNPPPKASGNLPMTYWDTMKMHADNPANNRTKLQLKMYT